MRWYDSHEGTKRTVRRFLFLPLTLSKETRWLEFAYLIQIYSGGSWHTVGYDNKYRGGANGR